MIAGGLLAMWFSFYFNIQMFKQKRVNPRLPAMLLNVLTCIYLTEIVVVANDFSLIKGWVWSDCIIAVAVWLVFMGVKHLKTKKRRV